MCSLKFTYIGAKGEATIVERLLEYIKSICEIWMFLEIKALEIFLDKEAPDLGYVSVITYLSPDIGVPQSSQLSGA